MFWSQLLQLHLLSVICYVVRFDKPVIDFFLHIALTLLAKSVLGVVCWSVVCHYRSAFDRVHASIFRSLARKKPTFNKTIVLGLLSLYATAALHLAQPSVTAISLALLQNFLCYLISDTHRYCAFYWSDIRQSFNRSCIVCYRVVWKNTEVYKDFSQSDIQQNYFPQAKEEEQPMPVERQPPKKKWKHKIKRSSKKAVKYVWKKLVGFNK